jgi:hypothetical protein
MPPGPVFASGGHRESEAARCRPVYGVSSRAAPRLSLASSSKRGFRCAANKGHWAFGQVTAVQVLAGHERKRGAPLSGIQTEARLHFLGQTRQVAVPAPEDLGFMGAARSRYREYEFPC